MYQGAQSHKWHILVFRKLSKRELGRDNTEPSLSLSFVLLGYWSLVKWFFMSRAKRGLVEVHNLHPSIQELGKMLWIGTAAEKVCLCLGSKGSCRNSADSLFRRYNPLGDWEKMSATEPSYLLPILFLYFFPSLSLSVCVLLLFSLPFFAVAVPKTYPCSLEQTEYIRIQLKTAEENCSGLKCAVMCVRACVCVSTHVCMLTSVSADHVW